MSYLGTSDGLQQWRVYVWMEFVNCMALGCEYILQERKGEQARKEAHLHTAIVSRERNTTGSGVV